METLLPENQPQSTSDLSRPETRERLGQSAVSGFFAIIDKWAIPSERAGELLGGMPHSAVYKLKSSGGTLQQNELTRISCLVGIYDVLHILLPDEQADRWVTKPNDNLLFGGQTPLDFMANKGISGLHQVRNLLDSEQCWR